MIYCMSPSWNKYYKGPSSLADQPWCRGWQHLSASPTDGIYTEAKANSTLFLIT